MGLHAGVCEEREGDYFGPAVNRVARLLAVVDGFGLTNAPTSAIVAQFLRLPGTEEQGRESDEWKRTLYIAVYDLLAALAQVTNWKRDGNVIELRGAATLRFRLMTN